MYIYILLLLLLLLLYDCLYVCFCFLYYRSTSPPGGNQVDGLPPALRHDCPRVWIQKQLFIGQLFCTDRTQLIVYEHLCLTN